MPFRLGSLTLDAEKRQLLRGRTEIHLSPKAFDLLNVLVDNRPRALSKRELHESLWPDTFVSEANLAGLIAEIRRALGDDAQNPTFVRTAQRFGYAFCGSASDAGTARDAARHAWLVLNARRLVLNRGRNVIGRDLKDGICVESPTVSRRHAVITVEAAQALLEDLSSKNGTFLRNQRVVSPVRLSDGDEIRLGSIVLHFRIKSSVDSTLTDVDS